VSPFFVWGYSDSTTHPALTQEIVDFFNANYPDFTLTNEEKELIIQGSINEDKGARWLHHFYDPVYNRGLVLEDKDIPDNPELALIAGGAKSRWKSSKEWARDTELQSGLDGFTAGLFQDYFSGKDDYSWDRAIYEYAWGDKERGLRSLGHILHLLEDASVPDHTRNETQKFCGSHLRSFLQLI
jgi:hypothetical protein